MQIGFIKPYEEEFIERAAETSLYFGKPALQITRELGCMADTLRTWKHRQNKSDRRCLDPSDLTLSNSNVMTNLFAKNSIT